MVLDLRTREVHLNPQTVTESRSGTGERTCVEDAAVQQAGGQEGFVFTGADLCADNLRASCEDTSVFLVKVDAGHGRHVVNVIIISEDDRGRDEDRKDL